eukprot:1390128-Ditylum_brightwellii.AAC.1
MNSIVADMQAFNGEMDVTKFQIFWDVVIVVLEDKNGSGSHRRQHAVSNLEITTDVSYTPGIVSIPQSMHETTKYLTDMKTLQEGVHFKVPSLLWMYIQLLSNNKFKKTAQRYMGHLPL